jgi:hypothetical protein
MAARVVQAAALRMGAAKVYLKFRRFRIDFWIFLTIRLQYCIDMAMLSSAPKRIICA